MAASSYFAPHAVQTGHALPLTMQSLFLTGRLLPFGAKLTVRHAFCNADTFSVDSKLEPVAKAVRTYENAVAAGSFAALARDMPTASSTSVSAISAQANASLSPLISSPASR